MTRRIQLLAILLASSAAVPAIAQTAAPDDGDIVGAGEQIIVTAQKIEQRAMDVPITISAISGKRMEEIGVSDLDELSNYIPGLNIQEQSANNPGIVIRGITSDSGSAQQAPRVTLYYNGVDISRSRGSYQDIYDMERIEVIKGPQATLFGTASAVGAISMISARPKPGFSAELNAGYGNYESKLLSGFINGGSDKVAGRIAFAWKKRDGYVKNLSATQDDLYARDQLGVRGSLRLKPTESFTADLILTYDRQRNSGTPFISRALPTSEGPGNPFGSANLSGSPLSGSVLRGDKLGLHRDVYDANLTFSWDIMDDWTLTMVNGYRKFDSNEVFDADGSAAWYLEFGEEAKGWQVSHETRFSYAGDHFRGSFGWNGFREKNHQRVPFSSEEGTFIQCLTRALPGLGCINAAGVVTAAQATALITGGALTQIPYSSVFENRGKNDSYSMFADGTWIASPSMELTAGIRALIEKRRSGYVTNVPVPRLPSLLPAALRAQLLAAVPSLATSLVPGQVNTGGRVLHTQGSFAAFLPRFNILYRFSPALNGFATVSKGRRSPTVNLDAAPGGAARISQIAEENVWNYEVGLKGNSGIFSGSLGVYYQKYDNFQVSVVGSDGVARTMSAGTASNLGVEAEVMVQPTNWLNIFANGGYIDGGIDDKAANGRFAGDQFRLQPKFQAAAGFTIDAPIGNGMRVFATPSVTYRSKIYFEVPNTEAISQDGVTLVNLRAGVGFVDGQYEISGFMRNATNKNYLLDAGNTGGAFGIPTYIPAEPRFYGVQLTGRF
ncbi:MAG: TonB-dependent receptor [Alphaproteobacteria bacterium]|jgi:iron complex outermembrane receptor protein|uniref:TonB-dependent receptor n=1 Tax=Sphingobium TaxID=165695 RepID=UPI0031383123|nr:TonB-dependent receptor [Alphaproteobacteria bacterium]